MMGVMKASRPATSTGLGVILGVEDDAVLVDFRPHQRRIPLPCARSLGGRSPCVYRS
jgi:hypothetical protein